MTLSNLADSLGRWMLSSAFVGFFLALEEFLREHGMPHVSSWLYLKLGCAFFAAATVFAILAVASSAVDDVRRGGGE